MAEPMRVLQIMGPMGRGGAENMIMELYRHMDRSVIQFDFVEHNTDRGSYDDEIEALGGRIFRVPRYRGSNHFAYKRVWKRFFREHPEYKIIHCHIRSTASIICKIARKFGVKSIAHSHNTSNGGGISAYAKKFFQGSLASSADYLFGCSREAGLWLFGEKAIKGSNYRFFPNATNVDDFLFNAADRASVRSELGVDEDTVVYVNVARYHPQKNHLFLVEAFAAIHEKQKNSVLVLVGDGELRKDVEAHIQKLGIEEYVRVLGVRRDIPRLMNGMDAFLLPSKWEGLPVTMVEAQANGLPCLISDTVTRDVNITPLIHYIPIDKGFEPWVSVALTADLKREDHQDAIRAAGFDIHSSVCTLRDFYRNIHPDSP